MAVSKSNIFSEVFGLVILVALIPVAYTFIASANITDAVVSTLIGLTPLVIVLAYLYGLAKRHGF